MQAFSLLLRGWWWWWWRVCRNGGDSGNGSGGGGAWPSFLLISTYYTNTKLTSLSSPLFPFPYSKSAHGIFFYFPAFSFLLLPLFSHVSHFVSLPLCFSHLSILSTFLISHLPLFLSLISSSSLLPFLPSLIFVLTHLGLVKVQVISICRCSLA